MDHIEALDKTLSGKLQDKINSKTKPLGALGQLEAVALQLGLIQRSPTIAINKPHVVVFAADHGIAARGVSIAPSEVTAQMVANFLNGGAAINCFCNSLGVDLTVVDAGIKYPLEPKPKDLVDQSVGRGTQDISIEPAMTMAQVLQCLEFGKSITNTLIDQGSNVLAFGEMGIGNTSSATALLCALTGMAPEQCVGKGTGISDEQLQLKTALIKQAIARVDSADPLVLIEQLGGFEIAQICGAMLGAAQRQVAIVVDGFIATSAAMLAHAISPNCLDYMIFAHCSEEAGHKLMLAHLHKQALLDLGMRLGEGTGAVLAIPLLRAAAAFLNDMASFESAGVTV